MKLAPFLLLPLLLATPAFAQSDTPLDLSAIDPSMLTGFFGKWRIQNEDGSKTCDVTLTKEETIGGMVIDIDPECAKAFPVMDEIAAWRLNEGFDIVLADATRKERLHFYTPDNSYVAVKEVDGIFTILQVSDELEPSP